jgi:hypothetical protein
MLAIREEEGLMMVAMLLTAISVTWLSLAYKHRRDRLRTIEKTLAAGTIDDATRRTLLDAIAADAQQSAAMWRAISANVGKFARVATFVVGWLTFTIGGCVLASVLVFGGSRYDIQGATIATAIGFGLVTLPLAMREIDARRSARS